MKKFFGLLSLTLLLLAGTTADAQTKSDFSAEATSLENALKQKNTPDIDDYQKVSDPSATDQPKRLALWDKLSNADEASYTAILNQLVNAVNDKETLRQLSKEYNRAYGPYRQRLALLISKLVQGNLPCHMINRLGDQPVDSILDNPQSIIKAYEELLKDWDRFLQLPTKTKQERETFLLGLKEKIDILSPCDLFYIVSQLSELKLDEGTIAHSQANSWLMLGYNYHYFYALEQRARILECLKKSITLDQSMAADPLLIEVAQKSQAFEDPEFDKMFKNAGGKQ